jgi:photosystem II PsbU protein
MKILVRILSVFTLIVGCFGLLSQSAQALNLTSVNFSVTPLVAGVLVNPVDAKLTTEFGQKIDLNNSNIRAFRELRGFYPNLASKIIKNSPYDKVEDVLDIPALSETQKARLQANLDKFTVTETSKEFNEGDDRLNPGVY